MRWDGGVVREESKKKGKQGGKGGTGMHGKGKGGKEVQDRLQRAGRGGKREQGWVVNGGKEYSGTREVGGERMYTRGRRVGGRGGGGGNKQTDH